MRALSGRSRGKSWLFPLGASKFILLLVVYRMAGEIGSTNAFAALLYFFAYALFVVGLEIPGIAIADGSFTSVKLKIGLAIAIVGLGFFLAAQHAEELQRWLGPKFSASVDVIVLDFRVWVILAGAIFTISTTGLMLARSGDHTKIIELSKEITTVRGDFNRYLKPRSLTPEQSKTISDYLNQFDGSDFIALVIKNDPEALNYSGWINLALHAGKWHQTDLKYVDALQDGLTIFIEYTGSIPPQPHPRRKLEPEEILDNAFRQAKVPVAGGGSSMNRPAKQIYVRIGRRPLVVDG